MRDLSTTTVDQLNTLPATLTVPEAGSPSWGWEETPLTPRPTVGSCPRCGLAGAWSCRRGGSRRCLLSP